MSTDKKTTKAGEDQNFEQLLAAEKEAHQATSEKLKAALDTIKELNEQLNAKPTSSDSNTVKLHGELYRINVPSVQTKGKKYDLAELKANKEVSEGIGILDWLISNNSTVIEKVNAN